VKVSPTNLLIVNHNNRGARLDPLSDFTQELEALGFRVIIDVVSFGKNFKVQSILDAFAVKHPSTPDAFDLSVI
jgi:hypothetical protein